MSDTDRIADYFGRLEDANYRRTLVDGCSGCGHSAVFCRCIRWVDDLPCCPACSH